MWIYKQSETLTELGKECCVLLHRWDNLFVFLKFSASLSGSTLHSPELWLTTLRAGGLLNFILLYLRCCAANKWTLSSCCEDDKQNESDHSREHCWHDSLLYQFSYADNMCTSCLVWLAPTHKTSHGQQQFWVSYLKSFPLICTVFALFRI